MEIQGTKAMYPRLVVLLWWSQGDGGGGWYWSLYAYTILQEVVGNVQGYHTVGIIMVRKCLWHLVLSLLQY